MFNDDIDTIGIVKNIAYALIKYIYTKCIDIMFIRIHYNQKVKYSDFGL